MDLYFINNLTKNNQQHYTIVNNDANKQQQRYITHNKYHISVVNTDGSTSPSNKSTFVFTTPKWPRHEERLTE